MWNNFPVVKSLLLEPIYVSTFGVLVDLDLNGEPFYWTTSMMKVLYPKHIRISLQSVNSSHICRNENQIGGMGKGLVG